MEQKTNFMVRMPESLKAWLQDKAEEHERSMNWMIVRMLENTRKTEERAQQ